MRKIFFSDVLEQDLLYQRYAGLHERSILSQIILCRSLCLWYKIEDMELRIVQIISLLAHNSQGLPKSEVFRTWDGGEESCTCVCCFIFALLSVVQQGCYPFASSFVVKVCY